MPEAVIRAPDHLRKIQVMLVDSDQHILNIMGDVLKHIGFRHIFEAQNGFRAVELMRQEDIDLVITDWELQPADGGKDFVPPNPVIRSEQWSPVPPKDGADFVKYLRLSKYSPNPYVAIIMLTGLGLQDHIEYARDAGVNEIILKPLSMENLCQRIISLIEFPRPFITSYTYRGPCRRSEVKLLPGQTERRKYDVKVFRHSA